LLVQAFIEVFPHVTLWSTAPYEMMLVGSLEPIDLDARRIAARFNEAPVAAALREVGVPSPAALLATFVTDRSGLERYAAAAPSVTDDRPRIEYAAWVRDREILRTLPNLLALRDEPPASPEQRTLLRFYEAGLLAYAGDREGWAGAMRDVMAADGANPYYRWFTGGRQ